MTRDVNAEQLELLKLKAARAALAHVESGMLVGLGTGSTARHFIDGLGEKLARGELTGVRAVATSQASAAQAEALGIPLVELDGALDVAVDGMDELDVELNAIKGLGGALTREKIVESCARCLILIGDVSKRVDYLGQKAPVPIEILPFGWRATIGKLEQLGLTVTRRMAGAAPFITDNGNYIVHAQTAGPRDMATLAQQLSCTPGVVEHGLFLHMACCAYIATPNGVERLVRPGAR